MKYLYIIGSLIILSACQPNVSTCPSDEKSGVYTLYRDSLIAVDEIEPEMVRIHIATFDSKEGEEYNKQNCEIGRNLFENQPMVLTKFWCEEGKYIK